MAISEQFSGLPMDKLIGAPLSAAADASLQLAESTASFINKVGFDEKGNIRTAAFKYQKQSKNPDGTMNLDEMKVDVPMLAIVPIPNLQVDEVNVLFDMEVKQSEKESSSYDVGATLSGEMKLGIVKVNVSGSVSVHSENTRSSDNSAKYHVDVRATNHSTPEGLARVLDMMAANVAPSLVDSSIKDGNGGELPDAARDKAQKLKTLRSELIEIENQKTAAQSEFDNSIQNMNRIGTMQMNVYQAVWQDLIQTGKADDKAQKEMEKVSLDWTNFQNQAANIVQLIVSSKTDDTDLPEISDYFALESLKEDGTSGKYTKAEKQGAALLAAQNNAIHGQIRVNTVEDKLVEKRKEYNDLLSGN